MKNICVYGAASALIHPDYLSEAKKLGSCLAKSGFGLVFGGGNTGVMGACARGAAQGGGQIIGVAPEFFKKDGILFQQCTHFYFTETMRQRKEIMENLSQAFVMAPGGIGTLEEYFEILTLKQLGRHAKPIAVLNTRGYYDSLNTLLEHAVEQNFLERDVLPMYRLFSEPEELVQSLEQDLVTFS